MTSIGLLAVALWISAAIGRSMLHRMTVLSATEGERAIYATAIGLGIGAYGVYALGLMGMLSFWPITIWWIALATVGMRGMRGNLHDIRAGFRRRLLPEGRRGSKTASSSDLIAVASIIALATVGAIGITACFQMPNGHAWDAIAYHLADPKVFLSQHRVFSIPTEHHSNFPFTMEMLYTVGLLYDGYALANLFHLATGALTVLAVLLYARRRIGPTAGWVAALVLSTTPVFLWESTVAYIDVALALYATLSALAVIALVESSDSAERGQWAVLAGTAMGFALGIKYLALVPLVLYAALLAVRRVPIKQIAIYAGIAIAIGSPWYIKNAVVTHNPVYPYAYSVFPASRYWSADRAAPYQIEQGSFGYPHSLGRPAASLANLAMSPWRLLTSPELYSNKGDFTFISLTGGLYAAFCLTLAFLGPIPRFARDILILALLQFAAWFFISQHVRYLIAFMPLLAVVVGYAAQRLSSQRASYRLAPLVAAAVGGQVAFLLWGVFALPAGGAEAKRDGTLSTALSVTDDFKDLTDPDYRLESINRYLDIYGPMRWINLNSKPDDGVVMYDNPRGFYLDRPYIWGDRPHSSWIPYDSMGTGADLTDWFWAHGFRYVLIDENWAPGRNANPSGQETVYLQQWYVDNARPGTWRALVADAIKRKLWIPVEGTEHGVAVLMIVPPGLRQVTGTQ